jgi:hypothetical protein
MNPIEFLQKNGLNPDNFRTDADGAQVPQFAAKYNSSCLEVRERKRVHKKRVLRRRNILDVRNDVINEWFRTGNPDMTGIFVPYLMLDVFQIIASDHLAKVDFRKEEQLHYTELMNDYHRLNSLFFQELTQDKQDVIIQMFDDFGEYIHNEVEIFRLSIIGCIMELPDDFRAVCGSLCVSKLMISQAVRAWMGMYRKEFRGDDSSFHLLQSMERHIAELMNHYFRRETRLQNDINLSTVDSVRRAEENVVKKILKFLKEYDRQQSNG